MTCDTLLTLRKGSDWIKTRTENKRASKQANKHETETTMRTATKGKRTARQRTVCVCVCVCVYLCVAAARKQKSTNQLIIAPMQINNKNKKASWQTNEKFVPPYHVFGQMCTQRHSLFQKRDSKSGNTRNERGLAKVKRTSGHGLGTVWHHFKVAAAHASQ